MTTTADIVTLIQATAAASGSKAYLNIAPERGPGVDYIVFAFRSEVGEIVFDGVNLHRAIETIDFIAYKGGTRRGGDDETARGLGAIATLQAFLQRLGPALSAMSGLETGVTENGYHFARRRITINPHRAQEI